AVGSGRGRGRGAGRCWDEVEGVVRRGRASTCLASDRRVRAMIDLTGKVAIVTGGCRGIGRGTVKVLRRAGARVACVDVQDDKGEALANELGDGGLYVHADVTSEDQVAAAFGRVVERFGGIDTVFNNAGAAERPGSDPF